MFFKHTFGLGIRVTDLTDTIYPAAFLINHIITIKQIMNRNTRINAKSPFIIRTLFVKIWSVLGIFTKRIQFRNFFFLSDEQIQTISQYSME